ncbi:hypothetical protein BS50DRAFT_390024 [Corynespora cassiicola Philippines]|uniref:C2H2-type domain-containing protein n=1 Tax=Corynespora cassiicola Philippines TaxID=1448308 RepID=A0A2T2NPJ7_CORCC|nr:hypothetical protein BS50DRAFT_390024 [Corynespora cassiicola Philippines]
MLGRRPGTDDPSVLPRSTGGRRQPQARSRSSIATVHPHVSVDQNHTQCSCAARTFVESPTRLSHVHLCTPSSILDTSIDISLLPRPIECGSVDTFSNQSFHDAPSSSDDAVIGNTQFVTPWQLHVGHHEDIYGFSSPPQSHNTQEINHVSEWSFSEQAVPPTPCRNDVSQPPRRPGPKAHSRMIKQWLLDHRTIPYPTDEEVLALATVCGRTSQQIRISLNNFRARLRLETNRNNSSSSPPSVSGSSMCSPPSDFDSLDSWLLQTASYAHLPNQTGELGFDLPPIFDDNYVVSSKSTASEDSGSQRAGAELLMIPRRKGQRLHASRQLASSLGHSPKSSDPSQEASKTYHCTVCPKSFQQEWGWRRHEYSVHKFQVEKWTCMLNDMHLLSDLTCAFCGEKVDELDHFGRHNVQFCLQQDPTNRTFARKDGLKQHVGQIHLKAADESVKKTFKVPRSWASRVNASESHPDSLWCGFCLSVMDSTASRMDHVAEHFRCGYDMSWWIPRS